MCTVPETLLGTPLGKDPKHRVKYSNTVLISYLNSDLPSKSFLL